LQAKIRANWKPPSQIISRRLKKKSVEIRLTLNKNGVILKPRIVSSSGSKAIDKSVIEAIITLNKRITPPPESLEFILDFYLF